MRSLTRTVAPVSGARTLSASRVGIRAFIFAVRSGSATTNNRKPHAFHISSYCRRT